MSLLPIDWPAMQRSVDAAAERVASELRTSLDRDRKVSGLDWSVADLGAHLINEADRFERFGRGDGAVLDDVAAFNAAEIASVAERDPSAQAGLFLAAHARFAELAASHAGADPYTWFDQHLEWAEAAGIYLGELCIHTIDLARTNGRRASIDREDALRIVAGLVPILPSFVDPAGAKGFTGSFTLKLRGGTAVVLRFTDGTLSVEPADGVRTDCTINADPEAFLLVGYGRASQWSAIARGRIMAGGRKPWLGLRFTSLLVNP